MQARYLAPENSQVAENLSELQQLLSYLLSNAPDLLYAEFADTFPSFKIASKQEYAAKKACKKIKALYGELL